MSFDLNWFKTIPGLLITGGVVLLIVALIIFIVTSKNNRKEKNKAKDKAVNGDNNVAAEATAVASNTDVVDSTANMQNAVTETIAVEPMPVLDQPVQTVPSSEVLSNVNEAQSINTVMESSVPVNNAPHIESVSSIPVVESAPSNMPSSDIINQPVMSESMNTSTSNVQVNAIPIEQLTDNSAAPVNEIPTINADSPEIISVNTPEVAPVVTPTIAPSPEIVPINTTPAVEPAIPAVGPAIDVVPTVEPLTSNNSNSSPAIYGGVSQIIPDMNLSDNNTHQIYGGANPLENTQSVPVINPEPVVPSVNTEVQPTVNVVPDTLTPSIPMPSVSVEQVNDNNVSNTVFNTVSDNSNVIPTPQETPVVPVGIPAVQVVATAPIMPPDNK